MSSLASPGPNRLTMQGICRRFGSTQALADVDLNLVPGEVHALVGENGAGKSTLMKILSGAEQPDAGSMTLDGEAYAPSGPDQARRRGVAMVYQELTLAPHLNVEANVMLGLEVSRFGFIARREHRRRVQEALAVLEHPEIHPDAPVAHLSPGAQQLVEIARALLVEVRVLVLDEPTSSLTQEDAERLFGLIRRLKARGVTVVYISHFLEEVEAVADRLTVLRDGRCAGSGAVNDFTRAAIIERMVGRSLTAQYPQVPHAIGDPVLDLRGLAGVPLPRAVDLKLRRGEILGIAGIVGAGRTELLRTIFGLAPVRDGQIILKGVLCTRGTVRGRIAQGVGFLSEDRKQEGLALEQSIIDNLTYSRLWPYSFLGCLNVRQRRQAARQWLQRLGVRYAGTEQPVRELSGGNQQKVALGRLLHQHADVLLLDEPTRGVDVGSKAEIYRLMGELAAQGKAILFVSSYLPELLGVCDRLAVMTQGRLSSCRPVQQWTAEQIMAYATRGSLAPSDS
ncbi:MAG TPA: sugar ABC transporter ATP-binding protein [Gemmataceae bacterium]|nr:sugar ABC transporter ATP-binding protein [Gemmataceae bacterium]